MKTDYVLDIWWNFETSLSKMGKLKICVNHTKVIFGQDKKCETIVFKWYAEYWRNATLRQLNILHTASAIVHHDQKKVKHPYTHCMISKYNKTSVDVPMVLKLSSPFVHTTAENLHKNKKI
jgi:hypothetical protein